MSKEKNDKKHAYEEYNDAKEKEEDPYDIISTDEKTYCGYHEEGFCSQFLTGMRSCWATKHTEDTGKNRELYIKTTVRELVIYITFLVIISVVTYAMTSNLAFWYTNLMNGLFITSPFADKSGSFSTAICVEDFWKFLTGPLLGGLYWSKWYNNASLSSSETNFIAFENKLIGLPRIRQVRVRNNSCAIVSDYSTYVTLCYAQYSTSIESTDPFGLANSTAWNYTSTQNMSSQPSRGTVTTYGGGGYYVDLNLTQSDSLNTINFLYNNLWIDRGTRAVMIDFTVYNANINLFCVVKILAEFPATGGMIPNYQFRPVKLIRYVTPSDYFVMIFELMFIVFTIYYLIEELIEIKTLRLSYFLSCWNWLDIIVVGLSVAWSTMNLYRTIYVTSALQMLLSNSTVFSNFDTVSNLQTQFDFLVSITVFFSWVKIFKYISFNKTMTQLSTTLSTCAKDLIGFSVMFFVIFLGFAQMGYLLFGAQCANFNGFFNSVMSLFLMLLGSFDFAQLDKTNRVLGCIYFILYVFFVSFVLFNIFMAIIMDTYGDVKEELAKEENEFEMADYFKQQANVILNKLNFKRDQIIDLQHAISKADANNDNLIDFDEWKAELKMHGYADDAIEEMFKKYDTNDDRVLDESERRDMLMELENQKAALNQKINKEEFNSSTENNNVTCVPLSAIAIEDYNAISTRINDLEDNIDKLVSKVNEALQDMEEAERSESERQDTLSLILTTLKSNDLTDVERRKKLEKIIRKEIKRMSRDLTRSKLENTSNFKADR